MKLISVLFFFFVLTSISSANNLDVGNYSTTKNVKHTRAQDLKYKQEISRLYSKRNIVDHKSKQSVLMDYDGSFGETKTQSPTSEEGSLIHSDQDLVNQPEVEIPTHRYGDIPRYIREGMGDDISNYHFRCKVETEDGSSDDISSEGRWHAPDLFNCSQHCVCENLSFKTRRRWVYVNCMGRNLTTIPDNLPTHTIYMKISYNSILTLNFTRALIYEHLEELYASNNRIGQLSFITSGHGRWLRLLDLSYNRIKSVSGDLFKMFPNLKELNLHDNLIEYLTNDSFDGLQYLKHLDLSFNNIHNIECGSFRALQNLNFLFLDRNTHLGYGEANFPPALFNNMTGLKSLYIQGSSNGATDYPNKALAKLTNLQELNIDALAHPAEFEVELKSLTSLRILRFGPYADCRLVNMSKSFFQYFTQLTCLYYNSCNIKGINPQAYHSLGKLEALTLRSVPSMTLDEAFFHLAGFKQGPLRYIGFVNLTSWYWPCIWMSRRQGKFASHLNLTTINLSDNRLSLLENSFLKSLPKTIEKLILVRNKFTLINPFWTALINFTKLTYLDLSKQNMENHDYTFNHFPPTQFDSSIENIDDEDVSPVHCNRNQLNSEEAPLSDSIYQNSIAIPTHFLNIPVNLKIVKAGWYNYHGNILLNNKIGTNSLTYLNFSRSSLNHWGQGKIPSGVQVLDLSKNSCRQIRHDFFEVNNSLTHLYLHINNLGSFIGFSNGDLLKHLDKLKYLDLSQNQIYQFNVDFFKGLKAVEKIKLRDNRLNVLNVSFEHTPALTYLDLRRNSINDITKITRDQLDKLAMKESGMVIDLHYNNLLCTCDRIDMLKWMSYTKVLFLNQGLYQCRDVYGKLVDIRIQKQMLQQVDFLQRYCMGKGYLLFGCLAAGIVFLLAIITGIAYRFRWWIRYKKHAFVAKWFGFKSTDKAITTGIYRYDAFLLYADDDRHFACTCSQELEKKRQHKFCIGDRDILPGTSALEAIVSAVQNSRVTLVLVTDNFVDDMKTNFSGNPMLHYAIQMAVMEEYCTNRKTLHIVQCTHHENIKYLPSLLKVLHDECATLFPLCEESITSEMREVFWKKLSETIGHTAKPPTDEYLNGFM